ncbi:Protein phosphatase inhibitor [Cordyceps militaris CM01]|uniref:Protein phosphatase inhibitor n=1 Tax=Cordyceps militaris (strain CM01) TaxID=983644 RepID=G3JFH4_CORMM|nr:Protein phosphatase inhibitor [Cordyceps militaris CM01]EGX93164.1 Protein phosphatase inhibitor [Cordyceps militaris CM01]
MPARQKILGSTLKDPLKFIKPNFLMNLDSALLGLSELKYRHILYGCGAFTQTTDSQQLGYYDIAAKRVRTWLNPPKPELQQKDVQENEVVQNVLKSMDSDQLTALGFDANTLVVEEPVVSPPSASQAPVCDRCHDLIHHNAKSASGRVPMFHPTVESLRETIEESPHKYNHIYHVIDAADFPMSLIPRLNVLLGDIPLRTRNRRSRSSKFLRDRQTELSFIITRSDLLGPTKQSVDALMPYLREVLRDALGRLGGRVRLGNVRCVSASHGWWTRDVKEDIWRRGGAGWMVGKVNVGKSRLFEEVYPKGRLDHPDASVAPTAIGQISPEAEEVDVGDLLPPARGVTNYPAMPLVSSLPGTTASPIRIPFGNKKGELIDLPGLARSDLDLFVKEEHRQSLIMKKRIVPEQATIKPGQSLVLGGGLIRITPSSENTIFLMYNFTPLEDHITSNEKAADFQAQAKVSGAQENISLPATAATIKHAGRFTLQHDVTRQRAGPLTRKNSLGLSVDRLPFRVLSVDILIEGVGYVEIVAQVRTRSLYRQREHDSRMESGKSAVDAQSAEEKASSPALALDPFEDMMRQRRDNDKTNHRTEQPNPATKRQEEQQSYEVDLPAVDIYTPEGRFVEARKPINGWLNNKPRVLAEHKKSRPRKSMKGQKKKVNGRSVQWAEDVVDNEGLGRKSSKVCCIYHKPKAVDESSDESSSDSSSDSESDYEEDMRRGKGRSGRGHDKDGEPEGCSHSHGHDHGKPREKQKRPPSPNAYEKVPKPKRKDESIEKK